MPKKKFTKNNISNTENTPCTYKFYNTNGKLVRVGSTRKCRTRLSQHYDDINMPYFSVAMKNSWNQAHELEKAICNLEQPTLNLKCG